MNPDLSRLVDDWFKEHAPHFYVQHFIHQDEESYDIHCLCGNGPKDTLDIATCYGQIFDNKACIWHLKADVYLRPEDPKFFQKLVAAVQICHDDPKHYERCYNADNAD